MIAKIENNTIYKISTRNEIGKQITVYLNNKMLFSIEKE